ncbi:hypothetical protein BDK51DRAFT_46825 [Blyttiomyces helicus]|uniref:Uncharacterized protein n=1 Tax=Blyttiomyces helicus TaxID=388810 RepID=A0A4P9W4Q6_9FUNG|nr:hypothetical protein BDK51DRAFT_46825 [Blyttiomyces helicus]|eukprot:RKO86245.1 hypothetical protein BDK51DRAFT_46825 [Blyttiomyces helicus]
MAQGQQQSNPVVAGNRNSHNNCETTSQLLLNQRKVNFSNIIFRHRLNPTRPPVICRTPPWQTVSHLSSPNPNKNFEDRDLVGYSSVQPDLQWPNGAKLANSFVVTFEESKMTRCSGGKGESTVSNLNGEPSADALHPTPQSPGYSSPTGFTENLTDALDTLLAEGRASAPKLMSIGLHCRLAGRPDRVYALARSSTMSKVTLTCGSAPGSRLRTIGGASSRLRNEGTHFDATLPSQPRGTLIFSRWKTHKNEQDAVEEGRLLPVRFRFSGSGTEPATSRATRTSGKATRNGSKAPHRINGTASLPPPTHAGTPSSAPAASQRAHAT